ncbi:MAG: hypothetical protein IJR33_02500 [Clostridia bacterium]|nr:hypothetical protein [Clostridia bacterium]
MTHFGVLLNDKFEALVRGDKTGIRFINDIAINEGDMIGVNEIDENGDRTGRHCVMMASYIEYCGEYQWVSVQPCRVEPHRRLTAAVYGEKEGGNDDD